MKILTKRFQVKDGHTLQQYKSDGGYQALEKALSMDNQEIIDQVIQSNLRGRGGAGFPAGRKWSFVPRDQDGFKYIAVNADESEPGTFKDRYLLERDPHLVIEGAIIAAKAINATKIFFYLRGEFDLPFKRLRTAVKEAYAENILGHNILGSQVSIDAIVHAGAGAYICGEETALLESLEGKRGNPRLRPPFPAIKGAFESPTVINNVETVACVPAVITMGAEAYANLGIEKNGGTKLIALSGHVNRPGVYEIPFGKPLRKVIEEEGQGVRHGRKIKAIIPGGSSVPILKDQPAPSLGDDASEFDVPLDFDSLGKVGSMLGSAAIMVMDETTCMVRVLSYISKFYEHESCSQCTPCREGTPWLARIVDKIERGDGTLEDIDLLEEVASNIMGRTICALGDAAAMPVKSFISKFRSEFEQHVKDGACPFPAFPVEPAKEIHI